MKLGSLTLGTLLAASMGAATARAADDLPPAIEQTGAPFARGVGRFEAGAAIRTSLFRGVGFDPFSSNDAFSQTSLRASWTALTIGKLSTSVGPVFEWGSAHSTARSAQTGLSLARLGGAVDERFVVSPRVRVFARLAASRLSGTATLTDPSLPLTLERSFSTLAVDASAGAQARLNAPASPLGFWLTGESGYGWAGSQSMVLSPKLGVADRDKAGSTTLADLAPSGMFFRFGVALTY